MSVDEAKAKLRTAKAVCFDVDSTVIQEEAIDVLAAYKGVGEAVANLTKSAMGGQTPFYDALTMRLNLIKPSQNDLKNCQEQRPFKLTPKIVDVVSKLHAMGIDVYLVSGGFKQVIIRLSLTVIY